MTAGVAGLVAGALSMAAGEYVSVSSQRDTELADLRLEERELDNDPEGELDELTAIYESRGLPAPLARQVAVELSKGDPLATHARDELGLEAGRQARPLPSGVGIGALVHRRGRRAPPGNRTDAGRQPSSRLLVAGPCRTWRPRELGSRTGGAPRMRAASRVLVWGAIAMAATSGIWCAGRNGRMTRGSDA